MITSLILFAIAAMFNAVMDRVENRVAFNRSVFRNLNPKWWLKEESWAHVRPLPFTKYKPDAWHLSKSAMIFSVYGSVLSAVYDAVDNGVVFHILDFPSPLFVACTLVAYGLVWNGSFVLFYHKILYRDPK